MGRQNLLSLSLTKSLTERKENATPTNYKTVILPLPLWHTFILQAQLILEKATTLFEPKITFGFLDRLAPLQA